MQSAAWHLLDPSAPYRIRHLGKWYGCVLEVLAAELPGTQQPADREKIVVEVLREKFDSTTAEGESLARIEAKAIHGLFADHAFITGDELERYTLRVREELAAEQGLRIIESVAAGLGVLYSPDAAADVDPYHTACLSDLGVEIPFHEGQDGLEGFIDAVYSSIGVRWGPLAQDLFALGMALTIRPAFLKMNDPETDLQAIAGVLLEAVQEDAESLGVRDVISVILESEGFTPTVMLNHMPELARTAVAWRIEQGAADHRVSTSD